MDNQLKLLISLCEEEKFRLQKLIDECVEEKEYLMAHHYSEALYQVNNRLQTLNNIDNKLYDEKEFLQSCIEYSKKQIETEGSDHMKEYFRKRLQHEQEELKKLSQVTKATTVTGNETLLDETLKKLLDKKIKKLKLVLKKADNLFLGFSYSKKVLKVIFPYVKQHSKKIYAM